MGIYNYSYYLLIRFFASSRILKNRVVYKAPIQNELNHPLRIAESGRKEHISEPKQAIRKLLVFFNLNFIVLLF
jgi:hypothetical protein